MFDLIYIDRHIVNVIHTCAQSIMYVVPADVSEAFRVRIASLFTAMSMKALELQLKNTHLKENKARF